MSGPVGTLERVGYCIRRRKRCHWCNKSTCPVPVVKKRISIQSRGRGGGRLNQSSQSRPRQQQQQRQRRKQRQQQSKRFRLNERREIESFHGWLRRPGWEIWQRRALNIFTGQFAALCHTESQSWNPFHLGQLLSILRRGRFISLLTPALVGARLITRVVAPQVALK